MRGRVVPLKDHGACAEPVGHSASSARLPSFRKLCDDSGYTDEQELIPYRLFIRLALVQSDPV
jgi:hypothetical protein